MATQSRVPTGNILAGTWTSSDAASFFTDVDDPVGTPDDDTTYLSTATTDDVVSFSHAAFSLPASSTINDVTVYARAKTSGDGRLKVSIRVSTALYGVLSANLTGSYVEYSAQLLTNPDSSAAWTQADVEGTSGSAITGMGFNTFNLTTGSVRVTQVYAVVTYTTAGGGTVPKMALLGVG